MRNIGLILDLFTQDLSEWTVAAAAARTGLSRANVYNLMSSLTRIEVLETRGHHRYRIGRRLDNLRVTLLCSGSLRLDAWPLIDHLVSVQGETCHLAVLDRWQVIYIAGTNGRQPLTVVGPELGTNDDAHSSAVGKILLAGRPSREFAQSFVTGDVQPGSSPPPLEHLKRELALIKRLGYALDIGRTITGVSCVAAPVIDATGVTVAALGVCAPRTRFSSVREKLIASTIATSVEISQRIRDH